MNSELGMAIMDQTMMDANLVAHPEQALASQIDPQV